jgi:hypothetical protein
MPVAELVTEFGFKGNLGPLEKFNVGMNSSVALIGKMVAGIGAVTAGITAFVTSTMHGKESLVQLSRSIGVNIETMQELGYAASVSGSSAESLYSTLDGLSQTIGTAAQKGSDDFSRLGISVRDANGQVKTADVVLADVAHRFKDLGLSMQEQKSFASALGIDASLIQLMNKTSSEMALMRGRAKALGVTTQKEADQIAKFNESITTFKFGISAVTDRLAIGLSPVVERMTDKFIEFLDANRDLIDNGIKKLSEWFETASTWGGYFFEMIGRIYPVLIGLAGAFVIANIAALGFGAGLAGLQTLGITALIIGVALIVDDLIVAFQGGKSVIGDFFMEFFGWDIVPFLKDIVWFAKEIFKNFKELGPKIGILIFDMFHFDFSGVLASFTGLFDKILDYPAVKLLSGIFGKVSGALGFNDSSIQPGQTTSNSVNNNKIEQSVNVEIKTDDPRTAGASVTDSLKTELRYADMQLQRGGR